MADQNSADEKEDIELDLNEAGDNTDDAGEGGADGARKNTTDKDDTEDNEDEDEGEDKGEKPVSARASFIIGRQKQTIERLRSKGGKDDGDDAGDEANEDEGGDSDEEITPAMQKAIDRAVAKKTAPVISHTASQADENEIADLYTEEPEARKFDKRIRAVMKMPGWEAVPVAAIYHHLSHSAAQKEGARKKTSANREAAHLRGAGHQRPAARKTSVKPADWTPEDVENMSDEDVKRIGERIGRR